MTDHEDELSRLARRIGRTYHSHLAMAKRLQVTGRYWNAALICLSAVSSVAAVGLLAKPDLYDGKGGILWAIIGILTLVASLVLANANFKSKSDDAFTDYRKLQQLWAAADWRARTTKTSFYRRNAVAAIQRDYQALLDRIPNHSEGDYLAAMRVFGRRNEEFNLTDPTHIQLTGGRRLKALAVITTRSIGLVMPLAIALVALLLLLPLLRWLFGV